MREGPIVVNPLTSGPVHKHSLYTSRAIEGNTSEIMIPRWATLSCKNSDNPNLVEYKM